VSGSWLELFAVRRDWHGSCDFAVRATDRVGRSSLSNTFTVIVNPVNDPPRFINLPIIDVTEDQEFRFDITPYIDDVDNAPGELRISLSSPNAIVEGHIITFHYSTEIGTDRINISLTDGQATVYMMLEVRVAPVNDPPLALPVPDLITNEDSPLSVDLTAFAKDEEDAPGNLRWRVEEVPAELMSITIDSRNILTLTPQLDASGSCVIRLVVRDTGGAESPANVRVTVIPVNDPPVIGAIPDVVVKVNVPYRLDIRPFVSDVDNAMSELRVGVSSQYANVSGFLITFRYPDDQSLDREVVRINVSDGQATVQRAVLFQLRFPPAFTGTLDIITIGAKKAMSIDLTRYVNDREDGPSGLRWAILKGDPELLDAGIDGNGRLTVRSLKNKAAATSIDITVSHGAKDGRG
jgi:hypothetical protein